ncbi:MAG: glycine cleavage system protein GcvH [Bacteroidales bacterium]|nr:glycine cleavage system protein GcvH [Bacteroidales bacterium]MEA4840359.1 glycine cleavage system protein GcvH [Bacteroidales bacterium]
MNVPENLKFTKDHEWIKVEGSEALVGITDYAQSELGEIVYVELPAVGESREKETVFGTVEAVKAVSDLFMPVSGEVLSVNKELEDKPELINEDPYEGGWMIRIALLDSSELDSLMNAEQYAAFIQ